MRYLKSHRTLAEHFVQVECSLNSHSLFEGQTLVIDDWIVTQATHLDCHVGLDLGTALSSLDLSTEDKLGAYLTAKSSTTNYKAVSEVGEVQLSGIDLNLDVDPHTLGGLLEIELCVVVISTTSNSPLAPEVYDVVYKTSFFCQLDGTNGRASVELLDFEQVFGSTMRFSLWHFKVNPPQEIEDWLLADINSAITVYINRPMYITLSKEQKSLLTTMLKASYALEVIEMSLANEDILEYVRQEPDQEPGSLFSTAAGLMNLLFASSNPSDILHKWSNRRGLIESELQNFAFKGDA